MDFLAFYLGLVAGSCIAVIVLGATSKWDRAEDEFEMPHFHDYDH